MCETCGFPTRQHKSAFDRRDVLALGAAFSTLLAMPAAVADDTPPPKPQNILSPDEALARLKAATNAMSKASRNGMISSLNARRLSGARIPLRHSQLRRFTYCTGICVRHIAR